MGMLSYSLVVIVIIVAHSSSATTTALVFLLIGLALMVFVVDSKILVGDMRAL